MEGFPLKVPMLEECRVDLYDWSKWITNFQSKYAVVHEKRIDHAWFNYSGFLEYYASYGLQYAYEVPCARIFLPCQLEDTRTYSVNHKDCRDLFSFLVKGIRSYKNPPVQVCRYKGPIGFFCFSHAWQPNFPVRIDTPKKFAHYRIKASKFYLNTSYGRTFKSPTISDYQRFERKGLPYIDDGNNADNDYLYDYWEYDPEVGF